MIGSFGLALLAGVLSTLSPCVLPLLPIVLGAAASQHRLGPIALAAGLTLSFVTVGLFVALLGFSIGLDVGVFRTVAAAMLLALGVVLMVPGLQVRLASAAGPVSNRADRAFGHLSSTGLWGQFGVGLLLGAVWSPCVGPTLGAASVLAAQAQDVAQVAITMALFGVGAALPLLLIGVLSRMTLMPWRTVLLSTGGGVKAVLGGVFVLSSGAILLGIDKAIETALVAASPAWLTTVTTRF